MIFLIPASTVEARSIVWYAGRQAGIPVETSYRNKIIDRRPGGLIDIDNPSTRMSCGTRVLLLRKSALGCIIESA